MSFLRGSDRVSSSEREAVPARAWMREAERAGPRWVRRVVGLGGGVCGGGVSVGGCVGWEAGRERKVVCVVG